MIDKILLVEDSQEVRIVVEASLQEFDVHSCATLQDAEKELKKHEFACLILDIELPDGDGVSFFSKYQSQRNKNPVPTIFLTGKGDLTQKLAAFSLGAEDFVTKPFEPAELRARVAARVKKSHSAQASQDIRVGNLTLMKDQMKIVIAGDGGEQSISLTSLEYKILNLFLKHIDRVYERDAIIDEVWGKGITIVDRTVDAHISHLRKKLSASGITIEAIAGVGYRAVLKEKSAGNLV